MPLIAAQGEADNFGNEPEGYHFITLFLIEIIAFH
jgi:hypothetical protein